MILAVTVSICVRTPLPTPSGGSTLEEGEGCVNREVPEKDLCGSGWGATCAEETLPIQTLGEFSAVGASTGREASQSRDETPYLLERHVGATWFPSESL